MTELEQIAASVAKALGLEACKDCWLERVPFVGASWTLKRLDADGSNLFSDHWRARCQDWLLANGHDIHFTGYRPESGTDKVVHFVQPSEWDAICPASEFCARAIHALMKDKP